MSPLPQRQPEYSTSGSGVNTLVCAVEPCFEARCYERTNHGCANDGPARRETDLPLPRAHGALEDLVRQTKTGFNVPVYLLEYLLGKYCSSTDPQIIDQGLQYVRDTLSQNYVRADESEEIKSMTPESGSFSRGKEEVPAEASIVYNGNIDADIDSSLKSSQRNLPTDDTPSRSKRTIVCCGSSSAIGGPCSDLAAQASQTIGSPWRSLKAKPSGPGCHRT